MNRLPFAGTGSNNEDALNEISQWLELQNAKMLTTSMGDVQRRYSAIPYGWREIDIAALVAQLIAQQKISIKYGSAIVGATSADWLIICASGRRSTRRF